MPMTDREALRILLRAVNDLPDYITKPRSLALATEGATKWLRAVDRMPTPDATTSSPLEALEPQVQALLCALEDARTYRLGEASDADDPDLDGDDRRLLLSYEAVERTVHAAVPMCTSCHHRHLVQCDGGVLDETNGDVLVLCNCPELEGHEPPTCSHCLRRPMPGERHGVVDDVDETSDERRPTYVCLMANGETLDPMPGDPWSTPSDAEPPF